MKTEEKLKQLFDYQKFENNPELQEVIDSVSLEKRLLSDSSLMAVVGGARVAEDIKPKKGDGKIIKEVTIDSAKISEEGK